MTTKSLLAISIAALAQGAPVVEKASTISGFWYAPFASGGSGADNCAPSTVEGAPGSDDPGGYNMAAFFYGLTPDEWCTPDKLKWLETGGDLVYPGSLGTSDTHFAKITNSFNNGKDSFEYKMFTVGGGTTHWNADMIQKLSSKCKSATDPKGLIDYIFDAGYNGIIIDYEEEETGADNGDALKAFINSFETDFSTKTLAFTTMGNPDASDAVGSLISVLEDTSGWDFVIPQLYDADSCFYPKAPLEGAGEAFGVFSQDKVLIAVPQGVQNSDTEFVNSPIVNKGHVEWLYKPRA